MGEQLELIGLPAMSGAALSDYGVVVLEERRRLLGALVQRLTGQQVGAAAPTLLCAALPAFRRIHCFTPVAVLAA